MYNPYYKNKKAFNLTKIKTAEQAAEYQGEKVTLDKPMKGDVKKYKVYVKNDKGNVVKVNFGDPNMEIKRDDPERRKSFRARHDCDNPGPKWKARYWSCKMWSDTPVSDIVAKTETTKKDSKKGRCWEGYEATPGKKPYSPGSCKKKSKKTKKASYEGNALEIILQFVRNELERMEVSKIGGAPIELIQAYNELSGGDFLELEEEVESQTEPIDGIQKNSK